MFAFPSPLYAIVDTLGRADLSFTRLAAMMLEGGAGLVQLRAKALPAADFVRVARETRALARRHDALFLANDRVDVALLAEADGVHLGQDDLPVEAARRLLGPARIIGLSTHDEEQALRAEAQGADYIGFGPLFPTPTQDTPCAPRG